MKLQFDERLKNCANSAADFVPERSNVSTVARKRIIVLNVFNKTQFLLNNFECISAQRFKKGFFSQQWIFKHLARMSTTNEFC